MPQTPTPQEFAPTPGLPFELAPALRVLIAPNPSPMTERGTNTYLIGETSLAVIDPGPMDESHLAAILAAVRPGQRIEKILVSHTHKDHSPLARPLALATGAPVLAFGNATTGRSARMTALQDAEIGGGEGIDHDFEPDEALTDGDDVVVGSHSFQVLHTPGHLGNHLCFAWRDAVFTADHVMGWAPSLVSPPDGDLTDFMASLDRLETLGTKIYYPGHGAPIADGLSRTRALRTHRRARETAIRAAIEGGANLLWQITQQVYTDIPKEMLPAAARNVLAHLIDLDARGLIQFDGVPGAQTPVFTK